jgi:hypothetical protein
MCFSYLNETLAHTRQLVHRFPITGTLNGGEVLIFFHTIRGVASWETACPPYPHVLPHPGGGGFVEEHTGYPQAGRGLQAGGNL